LNKYLYVMLMENVKPVDAQIVEKHIAHLQELEHRQKLVLCGPFTDYTGGMVVLATSSLEEARGLAESDPFIAEGYKTFKLRTLEWAHSDNNYLLD